jgi:hypothetical protein
VWWIFAPDPNLYGRRDLTFLTRVSCTFETWASSLILASSSGFSCLLVYFRQRTFCSSYSIIFPSPIPYHSTGNSQYICHTNNTNIVPVMIESPSFICFSVSCPKKSLSCFFQPLLRYFLSVSACQILLNRAYGWSNARKVTDSKVMMILEQDLNANWRTRHDLHDQRIEKFIIQYDTRNSFHRKVVWNSLRVVRGRCIVRCSVNPNKNRSVGLSSQQTGQTCKTYCDMKSESRVSGARGEVHC